MHPPINRGKSHRQDELPAGAVRLAIIYETTDDLPDGQPWPPDGKDFWSLVAPRANGVTRWRRIALTEVARAAIAAERRVEKSAAVQTEPKTKPGPERK